MPGSDISDYFIVMNKLTNKPDLLVRQQEFFIFAGLWLWVGIISMAENRHSGWDHYLGALTILGLILLPTMVFAWNREKLRENLSRKHYLIAWIFCFCFLLPSVTLLCGIYKPLNCSPSAIVAGAICCFVVESLFAVQTYLQKRENKNTWIHRISFEGAVLIIIILVCTILGAMATCSLNNPLYHTRKQLLIGFEFNPIKIFWNFGTFLSFTAQFLCMYLCGYLLFIINSRFLVAKVFRQKGFLIYILSTLAVVSFLYPVLGQLLKFLPIDRLLGGVFPKNPFSLENAFGAILVMFLSLPVLLSLQWVKQNNQIVELEKEKTRTELDLLKEQLNPHFFFNTLNNLYALSLQQSKQTPDSIMQLSELMRYVIYKGKQAQVSIGEEVRYINDYMQLQQIRLRKNLDFRFTIDVSDDTQPVLPLLLIVFVENAFKHGVEPAEENALLYLDLKCDARTLYFRCENSFEPADVTTTGIGLANLKKRLVLLFPDKHRMETSLGNQRFIAEFELNLS